MRRDLVTRTISGTKVTATVVNAVTKVMTTKDVVLSTTISDEKKLTKAVAKALDTNEVLISIDATEKVEKLYGLPITAFMAHAMELDPKTREVINETPAVTAESTEE